MTMTQRVGTWVAVTILLVAGAELAAAQEPSLASTPSAQATKPAGGVDQGIKVHGRWTVDVRNPDGSLAARHEFSNALTGDGKALLAGLLGRYYSAFRWEINLWATEQDGCAVGEAGCQIVEFLGTGTPPQNSLNVDLYVSKGRPISNFALTGTGKFVGPSVIFAVVTAVRTCGDSSCAVFGPLHMFTHHALETPIPVAAGQIVQVRVEFSFS